MIIRENRSRPCPPALIGQPVGLHAGALASARVQADRWIRVAWMAENSGWSRMHIGTPVRFCHRVKGVVRPEIIPSAIVGLIRIVGCDAPGEGDLSGWRAPDLYGWRFEFHPIPYPIPCRGALGFWRVPESSAWHLHPQIPEDWQ